MQKIGLTGGIGSGKTTVAKLFEMLGVPVFYADLEAHKIRCRPEICEQIVEKFGESILVVSRTSTTDASVAEALEATENQIDNRKLADIIFNSNEALRWINNLIHPLVEQEFETFVGAYCIRPYDNVDKGVCNTPLYDIVIMESALIYEANLEHLFDKIIVIDSPEELRISRIITRENISKQEALQRINKQMPAKEKCQKADIIIHNDEQHSLIEQITTVMLHLQDASPPSAKS